MAAVYDGRRVFLSPVFRPLERAIYFLAGVKEDAESNWKRYAHGVLLVNLIGFLIVYLLQRLQGCTATQSAGLCGRVPGFFIQ